MPMPDDAEQRQEVAEARVVVEIEAQARRVDEHELARHAQLELVLVLDQLAASPSARSSSRVLHRLVFERIQPDRAQRAVQRR